MFSIGASIGLLGGAALIDALNNKYNDIFWIVGPIATCACVSFWITMARITPASIFRFITEKKSKKDNGPPFSVTAKETLIKIAHIDFIGALLVSGGAIMLLIGLNQVS